MVPIKQKTAARSAVWGEARTELQSEVRSEETAGSLDRTTVLGTMPGDHPVQAQAGLVLRGRYRLEEILVRRAETETWRAFDVLLVRPVVVHLLTAAGPNHALLAAAKKAAVAADFRVLRVLDASTPGPSDVSDDGWAGPYIVCEYAPGKSLADLLSGGPLSTLEAAWVVREIADALIGMHARGLYHQRLSPDTVVITDSGNVKIVGFLLEAELAPSHHRIRDPQQADVEALGRLLYAMLLSRWPGGHEHGLAAAPTDSEGHVLSPLSVQASVPPSLSQICDRIMSPLPGEAATRLRTATEVSAALSRVLGSADAAQDLEQRVQVAGVTGADKTLVHHMPQAYAETAALKTAAIETAGAETPSATWSPAATSTPPAPRIPTTTRTPQAAPTPQTNPPSTRPVATRQPKRPTRWRQVLVPLVLIVVLGGMTAVGLRLLSPDVPGSPFPGAGQIQAAASPEQWPVVAAQDFDPEGNGEEHPDQVTLAWDGNPGTSWTTMNYFEGDIGNKTGVGLIFDLGEVRQVSRVELDLDGNGTSLEVRVPAAAGVTSVPLSGVDQWRQVGTASRAPATTSIPLDQPVETRYVLIYLTELPLAGAEFTGGIAEARFWG